MNTPSRTLFHPLRAALLALAAFGVTVSAGCAQEDYYCDASGCFRCDGVGCRLLDPPARPPCRGDFECSEGTVCTALGCTAECAADADCVEGTVCRDGLCAAPQEPEPEPTPGTCTRNADCPASGLECRDGVCVEAPVPACSDAAPCASGAVCVEGACVPVDETCQFNFECGAGRLCVNQQCVEGCAADADCPRGQTCDEASAVCVAVPPMTGACTNDAACGANRVCLDSVCVDACTTDAACGEGRYCSGGVCRIDTRPRPFCTSNSDCAPGRPCIGGVCRTPCTTSTMCAMFDVQFNFCGAEGYCLTTNEVSSDCRAAADCGSGEACIDGVCR
jgi:Cys-rich repeat protein